MPEDELAIMRRIDALHPDYPFAGSRMLRDLLRGEGVIIGREKTGRTRQSRVHDTRGAWRDNVFVERLWRSVKYEEVCLRAYEQSPRLGG
jgi:hypothetical protein